MATQIKAEFDYKAIASPPGTSRWTMSLIIADRNLSTPAAFLAPHSQTRPGAGRWMPHGSSLKSGLL
jgi:hypothetical protein